jgi:hypothetical protein
VLAEFRGGFRLRWLQVEWNCRCLGFARDDKFGVACPVSICSRSSAGCFRRRWLQVE